MGPLAVHERQGPVQAEQVQDDQGRQPALWAAQAVPVTRLVHLFDVFHVGECSRRSTAAAMGRGRRRGR